MRHTGWVVLALVLLIRTRLLSKNSPSWLWDGRVSLCSDKINRCWWSHLLLLFPRICAILFIPCPGWTKEKSSCVLLSETNLQKARESGMLRPCPLTSAASWNAAGSLGRHCALLCDGLDPGKGFSWLRQRSSGSSGLCVRWYQGGSLKHGLDKYL